MASVTCENVSRIFSKDAKPAVNQLNLEIADGEFLVLVGPSGCGKSTSLRMIAGLEPTNEGRILIGGNDATGVAPKDRDVAMVFQNYALYPNMTVAGNMGFALRNAGVSRAEAKQRVQEAAEILQLTELLDRKPANLSGGQRQRVAMGRAIVRDPAVFCMDEPLSNLDAKLRVSTRSEISSLQRRLGTTTVYVTHDQVEAMTMGDRVAVLKDGELQQVDTPRELYDHPRNRFVASFIGSPAMNLFDCSTANGLVSIGKELAVDLTAAQQTALDSTATVGIRPEDWVLDSAQSSAGLEVVVQHVEELGSESYAYCRPTDRSVQAADLVAVHAARGTRFDDGEVLLLRPREWHIFHGDSGERVDAN